MYVLPQWWFPFVEFFSHCLYASITTSRDTETLGITDSIGSIKKGELADLVVIEGNSMEDIETVKNVKLVLRDGRLMKGSIEAYP